MVDYFSHVFYTKLSKNIERLPYKFLETFLQCQIQFSEIHLFLD